MNGRRYCAYCGSLDVLTSDHVVPKALYPESKRATRFCPIVVDACGPCNNSWSDDEAHFRNVLLVAGEPPPVVHELWEGKARRGFHQVDGRKRARDLFAQFVAVQTSEGERYMIYPARDARVTRIVRKIIRGLCHHHHLLSPVHDEQFWADVQKFAVPDKFLAEMISADADPDILTYQYAVLDDDTHLHSCWLLKFFGRTPFFGVVYRSIDFCNLFKAGNSEPMD
ncbi:MAG: hypothetical protein KGM97_09385 [Alphaproteobacteria bacterium]|nr:hypothetical protein [Alphaproteobacteria bacterium]MDE2631187.1 hypothetical protein [Alphaproteobacteria bacterium]